MFSKGLDALVAPVTTVLAILLLLITLPANAAHKLHDHPSKLMSSNDQLKQRQFQTDTLNEYLQHSMTRVPLLQRLIDGKLVILAYAPDPNGRQLNIQDYIWHGHSYIAVFSDIDTARRMLAGATAKPGMTLWTIAGDLLFNLFQNNEWIIINAGAENMVDFHADELRPHLHR